MRLRRKILQFSVFAGLSVLATGCGGLRAGYGLSPTSILLPGLVQADRQPVNPGTELPLNESIKELARN